MKWRVTVKSKSLSHISGGFPIELAGHFLSAIDLFKPHEVVIDPIKSLVTKLNKLYTYYYLSSSIHLRSFDCLSNFTSNHICMPYIIISYNIMYNVYNIYIYRILYVSCIADEPFSYGVF